MFESGSARAGWLSVLSVFAAILTGCNGRGQATPEQIAQFRYCSGFTAVAERAAYGSGFLDLATVGNLRAGQVEAGRRLLLPPEEMATSAPKPDAQGNVAAATPTDVARGMAEGQAMIDQKQQKELAETIRKCSELFAALVK